MTSLYRELKRRNVFKVAVAYIVAAWLVLQVADVVLNNVEAPGWIFHVILLLLAIGLPFSLIFAWAYELTPEGLKREAEVDRAKSITHQTGRKLDFIIIGVLVVALGYFAYDKFVLSPTREAVVLENSDADSTSEAETSIGPGEKSIAVLPFINLSSDPEQEYFSDGISEELLNVLAQFPDLRVAARTSSFQFKGQNRNISEIAETLNVAHVLEGSVRKSGNKVRVTAQLIKAEDGFHLWSNSYDRELTDIFAIQDEISGAIGNALKLELSLGGAGGSGERPTVVSAANPEAYEAYLRGRQLINRRGRESIEEAVRALQKALRLDSEFAPAHAQLAIATALLMNNPSSYGDLTLVEVIDRATPHIEKATALAPDLADVHAAKAILALNRLNYAAALEHADRALKLNPSYIDALNWRYLALSALGRYAEMIKTIEQLLEIDPLSIIGRLNYINYYGYKGRLKEGHDMADDLIAAYPWAGYTSHANLSVGFEGDLSGGLYWLLRAFAADPSDSFSNRYLVRVFLFTGMPDEARRVEDNLTFKADLATGRIGAAVEKTRRQWRADPENPTAMLEYADALYLAGDYVEALERYENLLAKLPGRPIKDVLDGSPEATARLAFVRRQTGDQAGAAAAMRLVTDDAAARDAAGVVDQFVHRGLAMLAALDGDRAVVFRRVRAAIDGGLRNPFFFQEPVFEAVRKEPDFQALQAEVNAKLDIERQEVLRLICLNNPVPSAWKPLPATCADSSQARNPINASDLLD